jgi:hypothetical protein
MQRSTMQRLYGNAVATQRARRLSQGSQSPRSVVTEMDEAVEQRLYGNLHGCAPRS